jgi:hypothetical protein
MYSLNPPYPNIKEDYKYTFYTHLFVTYHFQFPKRLPNDVEQRIGQLWLFMFMAGAGHQF